MRPIDSHIQSGRRQSGNEAPEPRTQTALAERPAGERRPGKAVDPYATTTVAEILRKNAFVLFLATLAYLVLFGPTLMNLAAYWSEDPDFSHGYLIPVISAVILWGKRAEIAKLKARPSMLGLISVGFFVCLFFVGHLTRTNIVQRVALWGTLISGCWAAFGFLLLRSNMFPSLYLLLAIPPHYALLNSVRLELKGYATVLSADVLGLFGVDASPQGNVLLAEGARLEVADACSGIRSLVAIIATATLFAYLFRAGFLRGSILVATAIPVTILINVLRIVTVAVSLIFLDVDLTAGAPHEALGFIVFGLSILALYASWAFYQWLFHWTPEKEPA